MDQKDAVRFLINTARIFTQGRLDNKEERAQHKDQCAERLAADGSSDKDTEVRYSDQAILANLDWGIEALEEAIDTTNMETKMARLDYAEKMLQVCAMLDCDQRTAGVPNFYLSAWAHLNLSYLWKLRNDAHNSVLHVLEMFIVDPFFSRIDFAPELWKELFLPHMGSIICWYSEARQRFMMEVIPDSSNLSFTADLDQIFNESLIFSMRPDQLEKLQELEQIYGESLNENTRLFAKYYKDCMNSEPSMNKKMIPMLPIAEPPMTPLQEVSRSIPDYVKFGPILPKNAGFSPVLRPNSGARQSRLSAASALSHSMEDSGIWDSHVAIPEEDEEEEEKQEEEEQDDYDSEPSNADSDAEDNIHRLVTLSSMKKTENENNGLSLQLQPFQEKNQKHSPKPFSPVDSPSTFTSKTSSLKSDVPFKRESTSMLRFLSSHVKDCTSSSSLAISPRMINNCIVGSPDSDGELIELHKNAKKNFGRAGSINSEKVNSQGLDDRSINEIEEGNQSCISLPMSEKLTSRSRPPKDFVCPITGQLFNDPVTLETGQTYERKAIQEWLQRGNTTCPITRQPLSANSLPKTNYVLKRLITSWKEQHPDLAHEFSCTETPRKSFSSSSLKETLTMSASSRAFDSLNPEQRSTDNHIQQRTKRFAHAAVHTSPTSVISQATIETIINGLKPHISCLCTSDDLKECEGAILAIANLWKDAKGDSSIHSYLSSPTTVNGFVEILSASLNREVLRKTIYILSELLFADESFGETLTTIDSDFECVAALLKNGLAEAAVIIYQLRPAFAELSAHNLIPSLVQLIQYRNEDSENLLPVMEPKDAAIAVLEQILVGGDENDQSANACRVISANGIPALVKCLDRVEARKSTLAILIRCMRADRSCRSLIASRVDVSLVLELFHSGDDSAREVCIYFLVEIVQLSRRTFCNHILKIIKDEGAFSSMHTFLVYLQMAPMEKQPAVATLLLQLDLQVEPRKMSIYREEALEALIEGLQRKDFPNSQMMALDALLSLAGRLTPSGRPYMEAWLLKNAGFDHPYNVMMKGDRPRTVENDLAETMETDEEAASSWEKRVAFVLCNHEKGLIFEALEECLKSQSLEMAKQCLIISTWLIHMLSVLPDTGAKDAARRCLLDEFINVLQSSRNTEEKILAALALKTFVSDPVALEELGKYATSVYKTLRKLKRYSPLVADVLKSLMNLSSVNATELWNCTEVVELDSSANGEVLSLLHVKGRLISSHSDGTIKVWNTRKKGLRIIQEIREHSKAVTCLYVPPSGEKLYSGSLDKTIRVWAVKPEEIHCIQVHDVKQAVYELTANSKVACFISQGTGVKVYNWTETPKHINFNKYVKCLVMIGDRLYCGCSGYSIQDVDLGGNCISTTFYFGTRKLLGKQSIYSLHTNGCLLFAGGSAVDGIAGKAFSIPTKAITGSFSTGFDILRITSNNDFVFTSTKCGVIEVWLKERLARVASIKVGGGGGHSKITSLTSDMDGGMLYAGSSDGKIRVWALD